MGMFSDMANGPLAESRQARELFRMSDVFTVSKRRSLGTVFLRNNRRVAFQQVTGIPAADPENQGAIYRDANNFLKVSIG